MQIYLLHILLTSGCEQLRARRHLCRCHRNIFKHFPPFRIYTFVQRTLFLFLAALVGAFTPSTQAAHTRASLLLSAVAAKPGDTVLAGVRLQMDPGWHTYWKNPGDSGGPTKIEWQLPPGITAGEIQWPVPEKLTLEELTTYIFHDAVILLVPLTLAADLKPGPLEIKAKVSWLECEKLCVPGNASFSAPLQIAADTKASAEAGLLETARGKLPKSANDFSLHGEWEKPATGDSRPLILEWSTTTPVSEPDFFPDAYDAFEVQSTTALVSDSADKVRLRKVVKKLEGDWPTVISGVLIQKSGGERQSFTATLPIAGSLGGKTNSAASLQAASETPGTRSLWQMLLYAFIGGLILNIMPCVLPVIALKILGFVNQAKASPRHVRKLGLLYAAGVLVSFLVLAALVIGIKAAGHRAGWGIQFSNPYFIVSLTVLVTLIALNLFGVFEVVLGGRAMSVAGEAAARGGASGAFFNGVLATVLATPCTAPFLGASLGFAFAQPAPIVVAIFLTIGAGLATPYVLLSWQPAWLKFLPKPGVWMERFKVGMGFPMLLTAVWLLSLAEPFYGGRTMWLAVFLVFVALAAWVFGFSSSVRGPVAALIILGAGYFLVLEGQLRWREPVKAGTATRKFIATVPKGYDWEPWSNEAVAKARASGHPVLVDFTANWCPTCNAVVKPVLQSESVRAKAKEVGAVALLADHSLTPPEISDELNRYERAGVPLVLVFPRDPKLPAIVLPETPTPGMVIEALEKAGK